MKDSYLSVRILATQSFFQPDPVGLAATETKQRRRGKGCCTPSFVGFSGKTLMIQDPTSSAFDLPRGETLLPDWESGKSIPKGFKACRLLFLAFALPKRTLITSTDMRVPGGIPLWKIPFISVKIKYLSWKSMNDMDITSILGYFPSTKQWQKN